MRLGGVLIFCFCWGSFGALSKSFWDIPENEVVSVIVGLKNSLEISKIDVSKVPMNRRSFIVANQLREHTQNEIQKQFPDLRVDEASGINEITPLWLIHSMRVTGKKSAVEKLMTWANEERFTYDERKAVSEMDDGRATHWVPNGYGSAKKIGWGIEKLKAPEVWALGFKGQGILVAMIDSGVNIHHPDLKPSISTNSAEVGQDIDGRDKSTNGVDDDGNGYIDDVVGWDFEGRKNSVDDLEGHGTQTAGIVGGRGTGGMQTGVAPKSMLLPIRTCCNADAQVAESNMWLGIQYAMIRGARVISMSLSIKHFANPSYAKWRKASEVLLKAGMIHINSAGNRGSGSEPHNIGAPGSNPPSWFHGSQTTAGSPSAMLTIGATDKDDKPRFYSSAGPVTWEHIQEYADFPFEKGSKAGLIKPEVCGPSEVPSTHMDGKTYAPSFGGTSSATPHIAGVAALLLSANRNLSMEQITEALQMTAVPVESSFNNRCGAGRVDVAGALQYVTKHFGLSDS